MHRMLIIDKADYSIIRDFLDNEPADADQHVLYANKEEIEQDKL